MDFLVHHFCSNLIIHMRTRKQRRASFSLHHARTCTSHLMSSERVSEGHVDDLGITCLHFNFRGVIVSGLGEHGLKSGAWLWLRPCRCIANGLSATKLVHWRIFDPQIAVHRPEVICPASELLTSGTISETWIQGGAMAKVVEFAGQILYSIPIQIGICSNAFRSTATPCWPAFQKVRKYVSTKLWTVRPRRRVEENGRISFSYCLKWDVLKLWLGFEYPSLIAPGSESMPACM